MFAGRDTGMREKVPQLTGHNFVQQNAVTVIQHHEPLNGRE